MNKYQSEAAKTAIYPEAGSGSMMALAYVGLGLGEAGEVQGKIKKILRDSGGVITEDARKKILAEVGDVLWYLANLCTECGTSLQDVADANIAKLQDRQSRGTLTGSGDYR